MFVSAPLPEGEEERIACLHGLAVLDTPAEALFDTLAATAAHVCAAPMAFISLVAEDRQWFKARFGSTLSETSRTLSFCAHALEATDLFEIPDARDDERFADHPMVAIDDGIRFYAGAPLRLRDGHVVGTLCVVDLVTRTLTPAQRAGLRHLSDAVVHALESRRQAIATVADAERAHARVDELYRSTPAAMFSMDVGGRLLAVSDTFCTETGYAREELIGNVVFDFLTPAARDFALTTGMPRFLLEGRTRNHEYEIRCKDGSILAILVSQVLERDESGRPLRSMGVFENISLRRRAEAGWKEEAGRSLHILEGTNAGTWEVDLPTERTRYNARWAAMIGHELEEFGETRSEVWRSRVHPEDLVRIDRITAEHAAANSTHFDVEYRMRHKAGHWIWVHDHAAFKTRAPDGTPLTMHGICMDITARKTAEEAARETRRFLERVGEVAGVGGWGIDFASERILWTDETCRLHDLPAGHVIDLEQAMAFIAPAMRRTVEEAVQLSIDDNIPLHLDLPMTSAAGREFEARIVASIEYENGRAVRLVGAIQDVTDRRQIEDDLAQSRELLQVTLDSIADAVITTDTDGRVQWLNPIAERLTGWSKAEAVRKRITDIFSAIDEATREPMDNPALVCLHERRTVAMSGRTLLVARDGTEYGIEESASLISDRGGRVHGAVLVFRDVSEQRRLVREMSHRASHDLLTGLYNRPEFEVRLTKVLEAAVRDGTSHVLLYIDLDQFKLVNDSCGHVAGDQLLRQVSTILRSCVRNHDTIARLGGDEFGIILEHCEVQHAQRVAQKICDEMDAYRFVFDDRRFRIGASIGLVLVDDRWTGITNLLQVADASCYAAKEGGRNRFHTWIDSEQIVEARNGDGQWVNRIEIALDENNLELYAQKIESIKGPAHEGLHFEVLLRLREPGGVTIPPGAFLPVAERFHLATRLDRWVVREAFDWMQRAFEEGVAVELMSINLSGQSLGDRAFHRDVIHMITHARFDVRNLCFEITETAVITHLTDARAFIEDIRSLGVKAALDDFGAGASSFGYLKSLPVDYLKIDGHFIQNILEDELNHAAVRCFCDVAKVVGVKTIAEFVENEPIREALRELGVDMTQGYLIHRPEPLVNLLAFAPASAA